MLLVNLYTSYITNVIITRYFTNFECLIVFSDFDNDDYSYADKMPVVRVKLLNGTIKDDILFKYYGCQGILIFSLNASSIFVDFENQIRLNLERFNRRRYLIMTNTIDTFFNLKELNFVSDLLLVNSSLDRSKESIFEFRTHKYVGIKDQNKLLLLDKWFSKNNTFLCNSNLYPDKLINQMGRLLKMAVINYKPYSIVGQNTADHQGSELSSVVQFALHYNMTPVALLSEKELWGEIFQNWTGTGIFGKMIEDITDIAFSSMYTWEVYYHYFDLSKPTVRTGVTCLVPAPKLAARWITPLYTFSFKVWISLLLSLVSAITALIIILSSYSKGVSQHSIVLAIEIVLKPIVLQPLTDRKMPIQIVSAFMVWLVHIVSLVLTTSYSSGLASVMTLPQYEHPIDTIKNFVDSNIEWGATHEVWITSIEQATDPVNVHLVKKFQALPSEKLGQLSKNERFAFAIERLPSSNFAIGSYMQRNVIHKFHLMKEDLYWEYCVAMLRKNSVLLPAFDLFILRVFAAGLISKWQNTAVTLSMDAYVQRYVKDYRSHLRERNIVQLHWSHVEGAFAILILGYIISFAAFIAEILSKNFKQ